MTTPELPEDIDVSWSDVDHLSKAPDDAARVTPVSFPATVLDAAGTMTQMIAQSPTYAHYVQCFASGSAGTIDKLADYLRGEALPTLLRHLRDNGDSLATYGTVSALLSGNEPPVAQLQGCPVIDAAIDLWRGVAHQRLPVLRNILATDSDSRNVYFLLGLLQTTTVLWMDPVIYAHASLPRMVERIANQVGYAPLVFGGAVRSVDAQKIISDTINRILMLCREALPDPQLLPWTIRVLMIALPLDGAPVHGACAMMAVLGPWDAPAWPPPCANIPLLLRGERARNAYATVAHVHSTAYGRVIPDATSRVVALVYACMYDGRAITDNQIAEYVATGSFVRGCI